MKEECDCGYFYFKNGIIHKASCKHSTVNKIETRLGFAYSGFSEIYKYFDEVIRHLQEKQSQLDEALEVIRFYANDNWSFSSIDSSDISRETLITAKYVTVNDEPDNATLMAIGGKKAREFLNKYKENKNENNGI